MTRLSQNIRAILTRIVLFVQTIRDEIVFQIDLSRSTIVRGIPMRLSADALLREHPTKHARVLDRQIAGSLLLVFPGEQAMPGWVMARVSSGHIGFIRVNQIDMFPARRALTPELARKLDLAEVIEHDPKELDHVLDTLLGCGAEPHSRSA